ncbi:MAG: succinate dehydrogenase, hydrophobic membrane anchor protein [Gammaproteobacteria bacterium]|nr:succinate dehydrogenase, hydrophobic membrane anchor protein [Gammaproteobacteria bacterium]
MSLRTPLGRFLGLGATHHAVGHWVAQRLGAVALVPLTLWFLVSLLALPAFDYATLSGWAGRPWNAVLLLSLVLALAHHSWLGVQVVVEDYVHDRGAKFAALIVLQLAHVLLAVAGVFAVLKIAFGSFA